MSRNNTGHLLKRSANFIPYLKMKTNNKAEGYQPDKIQAELADENGLAVIVIDKNSVVLNKSNNNSMCEALYNSEEFAPECAKFCGKAFQMATEARTAVGYKCYAGLNCLAVPLQEKKLVAIIGRAFLKTEDYRSATQRVAIGDWEIFSPTVFFENTLFESSGKNLEKFAERIQKLNSPEQQAQKNGEMTREMQSSETKLQEQNGNFGNKGRQTADEINMTENMESEFENQKFAQWRSRFGSLLDLDYWQACLSVLQFVSDFYSIKSLAWLECKDNRLEPILAIGELKDKEMQINIAVDNEQLFDALKRETSLELRERQSDYDALEPQTLRLFPIGVGDRIQGALVVDGQIKNVHINQRIARFCQKIASELEILRLRKQLERRSSVERAVTKFNESVRNIDSEDIWSRLTNTSAELLNAERSSLLVYDEKAGGFVVKAATGVKADFIKNEGENLGERVARSALNIGKAVVVENINKINLPSAPSDWLYKSDSFISYPILIGERKIAVLNVTDKSGGETYNDSDVKLLDAIAPSLAVMIDRADLKHKAVEFQQLSVTDPLTGLLNRRYLEERVEEEIKRSNRHGFPMSFMMIDVDQFKSYNDNFGHAEGDKALQIVGNCLKDTLRGIDIAARYGGEEFSILLPQTDSSTAFTIAERVRERVEQTKFPSRQVTISIGVASFSSSLTSSPELILAADKALYDAKRRGRNNVRAYEHLENNFTLEP